MVQSVPSISVVVPAFNRERFLAETLDSLVGQSIESWECIVVDDGSTDATFDIAQNYAARDPRVRAVRIKNHGASAARNFGFLLTDRRSEFVTFMDSDDIWLPGALETLRSRAMAEPGAVGAHGLAETIDEDSAVMNPGAYSARGRRRLGVEGSRLIEWPLDRPTDFSVLINGNVLFPPGLVLARRSVYEVVGRFDECLKGAEDWDMLIRLSRHGHLAFCNEVILLYRMHGENLGSRAGIAGWAWLVRCKAFHSPENSQEQAQTARCGWKGYQRLMMEERLRDAAARARTGRRLEAIGLLARVPLHVYRLLRGYPTPRTSWTSQPW